MRFHLLAHLVLSGDAAEAADDIDAFLREANRDLLVRGAAEGEGAEVLAWSVDGDVLQLELASGGSVRAPDALLRLRKGLQTTLGPKHHLGVRDLQVDELAVTFSVEQEPLHDLTVPFAHAIRFEGHECTLEMTDFPEDLVERNVVDRMINLAREKIAAQRYEGKGEYWSEMWHSPQKEPAWTDDPTDAMVARNWIKQGPTKGKWVFREPMTAILRAMERIAVEEVLEPLGFGEIMISHHVPFDVWMRSGHLHGVPNELYYVAEPKSRDTTQWQRFIDVVKVTREVPEEELSELVNLPAAGICYAQCPNIYWLHQGRTLADEDLPVRVYDRSAVSNRYESGGRHGIERVDEFHRIEPVYIGTREQLLELREDMIARYKHVFDDILDLEWRMAWVTPFYMAQEGLTTGIEEGEEVAHERGTIDFEAWLPYRGSREESEWLEFQNLSVVGDKYTSAFNIKGQRLELWSGCSGIGLERWSAAFLAQKGLDPADWPDAFRERLPELPGAARFL